MSLKIASLSSGSKGNSALVLSDSTAVLVDAGITYARLTEQLRVFGLTPAKLDGIVITHEHADHIAGLARICDKGVPVYAHELTARAIAERQGMLKNYKEQEYYEGGFEIGDIKVMPFRVPHDAAYPLGYTFEVSGGARVSVATDMGRPTIGVFNNICESEVVLLESNHDVDMLIHGGYPQRLKTRILGANGHLSNDMAAVFAERLIGTAVKTLLLGHLSENNNLPELAMGTVKGRLTDRGCNDIDVRLALQYAASDVFEVK